MNEKIVMSAPCRIHITPLDVQLHDNKILAYSIAFSIQVPRIIITDSKPVIVPSNLDYIDKGIGARILSSVMETIYHILKESGHVDLDKVLNTITLPLYRGVDIITLFHGGLILACEVRKEDKVIDLVPLLRCTPDYGIVLYIPLKQKITKKEISIEGNLSASLMKECIKLINGVLSNEFKLFIKSLRRIEKLLQYIRLKSYGSKYSWDQGEELSEYLQKKHEIDLLCQTGSGPILYTLFENYQQALTKYREIKDPVKAKFNVEVLVSRVDNMGLRIRVH